MKREKTKFNTGDKVNIIHPDKTWDDSSVEGSIYRVLYNNKLKDLEILSVRTDGYDVYNNDKSDYFFVIEDDLELSNTGTFMWAVEQMKAGKKARRKVWEAEYIVCDSFLGINWYDDAEYTPVLTDFEATDWEAFEDNTFGNFYINEAGNISNTIVDGVICQADEINDLKKAIKRVEELRDD